MKKIFSFLVSGIMMLTLTVLGGSFIPGAADTVRSSAAEADKTFTVQDVFDLQDHLLCRYSGGDLSERPYDLNVDGRWNVIDLCIMKRQVLTAVKIVEHSDVMIAYFSRTGNTERIAEYIKEITGGDSWVIRAADPYTDEDIEYNNSSCRANREQDDKTIRPEIEELPDSLDGYDTVFLGYPIWWGQEPRIIDTFLESFDFSGKRVIPFCTSASSGISVSEKNISALVPIGEQLPGRRFSANASKEDVEEWTDSLGIVKAVAEEETQPSSQPVIQISVKGEILTASLYDTAAASELMEMLSQPVTVELQEYGGFEKVGELPSSLTKSDESIRTEPGDIMLYQGNKMTIFYGSNSWSYTRLGHIDNVTTERLKDILGDGDVTAVLSIKK